jgi:DNA-binding response OmpR family regulator
MANVKTCYIIDDDIDDQEFFIEAVNEIDSSITCYGAFNGEEALEKLKKGLPSHPDIIFIDLNMPRLNGKQCLAEIRKMDKYNKTPVIIYSTSSQQKDIDDTKRMGAAHFLTKPSSFSELRSRLAEILRQNWT